MYKLVVTRQFKKDSKDISKADEERLAIAFNILERTGTLPVDTYHTHPLKGNFKGFIEAHIRPDFLIIWYEVVGNEIKLFRLGSHHKLFGK